MPNQNQSTDTPTTINNTVLPPVSIFTIGLIRSILFVLLVILLRYAIWLPSILLFFLIITIEGASMWSKAALQKVEIEETITPTRIFPEEKIKFKLKITNNKGLPAIIKWQKHIPKNFLLNETSDNSDYQLSEEFFLKWHSIFSKEYELRVLKRGYYQLNSSQIISADGLGLFSKMKNVATSEEIFVYPQIIPLTQLNISAADLIGENQAARVILPDPTRITGLQDYSPAMPSKLIHWKKSMQKDNLIAKILEPSSEYKILIVVDVDYFYDNREPDLFEKALSRAASIAVWAEDSGFPFGLIVNASQKGLQGPVVIPVHNGTKHLTFTLEKLARIEFNPLYSITKLLQSTGISLTGTSLILIGSTSCFARHTKALSGVGNTFFYKF